MPEHDEATEDRELDPLRLRSRLLGWTERHESRTFFPGLSIPELLPAGFIVVVGSRMGGYGVQVLDHLSRLVATFPADSVQHAKVLAGATRRQAAIVDAKDVRIHGTPSSWRWELKTDVGVVSDGATFLSPAEAERALVRFINATQQASVTFEDELQDDDEDDYRRPMYG